MRPEGLPIGRLFGIEIRVSIAWAILIGFVTLVGAQQATLAAPTMADAGRWMIGAGVAIAFLVSVLAHELAHALVARRRGIEPGPVVLGFVGGVAPLRIEGARPADELVVAAAGPAVSLVLAMVLVPFGALVGAAGASGGDETGAAVGGGVLVVGALNLILGLLSLVPGLPLDGGRIVRALAWRRTGDQDRATSVTASVGRYVAWATMGIGVLVALIDRPSEGLLLVALGWFLSNGARTVQRRLAMQQLLRGVPVSDAMERDVDRVAPGLTLDTFADRYSGPDAAGSLPVVGDRGLIGVLGVDRLRRVGRKRWPTTRAGDVASTPPTAPFLAADSPLWDALEVLQRSGVEGLAVTDGDELAGMLTRRGVADAIAARLRAQAGAEAG